MGLRGGRRAGVLRDAGALTALVVALVAAGGLIFGRALGSDAAPAATTAEGRRSPRPDARPCAAADLGGAAWTGVRQPADAANAVVVLLGNEQDVRCTLTGSAQLVATDPWGKRTTLTSYRAVPRPAGIAQYPATIDPGEPARLVLTPDPICADPVRYGQPAIVVGGREITLVGTSALSVCAVSAGEWHVIPPLING
jgi:hypothetical protein